MSTLTVSNIKKTGETASRDVSGVAAAWFKANVSGVASSSFNVSSITDLGSGNCQANLTNSMSDGNPVPTVSVQIAAVTPSALSAAGVSNALQVVNYVNSTLTDPVLYFGALHGDLA